MSSTHTYYTASEAAGLLGLTASTLNTYRHRGTGPEFVKLSDTQTGRVLYHIRDLRTWCAKREREEAAKHRFVRGRRRKLSMLPMPCRMTKNCEVDQRRGRPSIATRNPVKVGGE